MSARIKNVTTADAYTSGATVLQPESKRVVVQVANAAVYYALDVSDRSDGEWDSESFLLPTIGSLSRECSGIRFRSATPGTPAQVSAELLNASDLAGTSGDSLAPFTDHVSAGGLVTGGGGGMTGIVAGNGTITAGTGFTAVRNSAGNYTVTYSTPFAAVPVVLIELGPLANNLAQIITSSTAAGFTFLSYHVTSLALTDCPFAFTALAVA